MRIKVLTLLSLIGVARCAENSVSINVKNIANTIISDRFISAEINFSNLMNLFLEENSVKNLSLISPAYIKLRGFSAYLENEEGNNFHEADVSSLLKSLNSLEMTPVIVVDYNITTFEPISLLHKLKAARNLKINNCVWQLGESEVSFEDSKSLKRYVDDLKTLKILCESVKREHHLNWDVAAVGNSLRIHAEKLPFEIVAYDLKTFSRDEILAKYSPSLPKSQSQLWATLESSSNELTHPKISSKSHNMCDHECLIDGLLHAQILGSAAKKGLDVLFFDEAVNKTNFDFKKAVTILHKKLVGSKTFNVRVTKSSPDGKLSSLFSHCSKKTEGALTLMGINFSNMRSKFNVKISSLTDANAMVLQYLLSASDGQVLLNNEKFNIDATPSYKHKKLSKFAISLVLPPFSMAFWTIKNVKVNSCLNLNDATQHDTKESQLTSSDKLLKKLVASEFDGKKTNSIINKSRNKRQINGGQFLPSTFDFELPAFKFPNLMTSASNSNPIKDILFNKNTDVHKVSPADVNPLQSSENPTLPKGDVYMMVNDGSSDFVDTLDVVVDDVPKRYKQLRKKGNNRVVHKETTEDAPEYFVPHDYFDASQRTTKATKKKSSKKAEQPQEFGELFENERQTGAASRGVDQTRSSSQNIELKTVIKELEPTYRQSNKFLRAAKRKWDREQIMELLKDAQLEDVDRGHLEEADDFEVIDLTGNAESPNYDEYDEDEDGFFHEDKMHIRTRRDLNYAKNEIPKYGTHDLIDEDEEDSIENLMDDVHLYLQPNNSRDIKSNSVSAETIAPVSVSTHPPTTVKAINFFTQSLNQAINVLDKTLVGWWYVFNPSETS